MDKRIDITKDELNPAYLFQTVDADLLIGILNSDELDPREMMMRELANRGLDLNGKWVGFEKAEKAWGLK